MIEMFVALMTVPSPGSRIGLSNSQMIRPVGSSMTDHNDGNATMWLPGNVVIVRLIHSRPSSRPRMVPAACSMYSTSGVYCSTQASQSRVSAARATVSSNFSKAAANSPRENSRVVTRAPSRRYRSSAECSLGNVIGSQGGQAMTSTQKAILAGGCFWGMQDLIRKQPGVLSSRVGYSGGDTPNATYRNHGDHAEALELLFDPNEISFRTILEYFFQIHDPTTVDRQGNDRGRSYRSAIFYTSDAQRQVAQETILDVEASGLWPGKVATELAPVGDFWEAEIEHQDYLEHYPTGYSCHFVRPDWKLPSRVGAHETI